MKFTLVRTETTVVMTTVEADNKEQAYDKVQWPEAIDSESSVEVYEGDISEDDIADHDPVLEMHFE